MEILHDIPLAPYTTLKLGGNTAFFATCKSEADVMTALTIAREHSLPHWILGGGSNTIIPDKGFPGFIIKIEIKGMNVTDDKVDPDKSFWEVGAGESWDDYVAEVIRNEHTGIECLSGIPGTVGASPIQNIGAYGQEVADTIESVCIITPELHTVEVAKSECSFHYRDSRFKSGDWKEYIITRVKFRLSKSAPICIKYQEVAKIWSSLSLDGTNQNNRSQLLNKFRSLILELRKSKSMVIDEMDLNSKSVGSFFTNPILTEVEKNTFLERVSNLNLPSPIIYPEKNLTFKIPAAWLIENSGIKKGMKRGGVGISSSHSLALINIDGKTDELLEFAEWIRMVVFNKFQINLRREPVILQ